MVDVPRCGSVDVTSTGISSCVDVHTSRTTWIACEFPIAPAGIVIVVRVPVATSPAIVFEPRSVVVTVPGPCGGLPLGGVGGGDGSADFTAVDVEGSSRTTYPATGSKIVIIVRDCIVVSRRTR